MAPPAGLEPATLGLEDRAFFLAFLRQAWVARFRSWGAWGSWLARRVYVERMWKQSLRTRRKRPTKLSYWPFDAPPSVLRRQSRTPQRHLPRYRRSPSWEFPRAGQTLGRAFEGRNDTPVHSFYGRAQGPGDAFHGFNEVSVGVVHAENEIPARSCDSNGRRE
jgi:hypothetical protein